MRTISVDEDLARLAQADQVSAARLATGFSQREIQKLAKGQEGFWAREQEGPQVTPRQ